MFVSFGSNTMGVTRGTWTANPSETHEFTTDFEWGSCCSIFSFLGIVIMEDNRGDINLNFVWNMFIVLITIMFNRSIYVSSQNQVLFIIMILSGVRVARSLVFWVLFGRSLFVLLSLFLWPLYCLSFDLQIMIIPLVSFGHWVVCPLIYRLWLSLDNHNL
jgi:hypothetical protein